MATDIFVIVEQLQGGITDISFEMLGKGKQLAREGGGQLYAVLAGYEHDALISELGVADVVLTFSDEQLEHFCPAQHLALHAKEITAFAPKLILIGSTSTGLDLAASLSAQLGIPMISSCTDLHYEDEALVCVSQMYGGKLMIESTVSAPSAIVQVLPGAFRIEEGRQEGTPQIMQRDSDLEPERFAMRFESYVRPEGGDIDITQAPVLVSVGRGIQQQDNIELAEELARALGGAVSSSRPVVDQDWLPITRQVGKSGMTVKPRLYLALGISGAPEHVEGMKDAELIVGINTDPDAPIFNVAHFGVVADVFDVVPVLTERLAEKVQ